MKLLKTRTKCGSISYNKWTYIWRYRNGWVALEARGQVVINTLNDVGEWVRNNIMRGLRSDKGEYYV